MMQLQHCRRFMLLIVVCLVNIIIFKWIYSFKVALTSSSRVPAHAILHTNLSFPERNVSLCPTTPPNLVEFVKPHMEIVTWDVQEKMHQELSLGGTWTPSHCKAKHHVALLVPYRSRNEHLHIFINNIHHFLQKQQLHYSIYIIEQADKYPFNRGKLLNVGFVEAMKDHDWDCVILHDIDHIPTNEFNIYNCTQKLARHLSVSAQQFNFALPYKDYFGGVSLLPSNMYRQINGMPNRYWGWGGEDDDLFIRCKLQNFLPLLRYPVAVGRYETIRKNHRSAPIISNRIDMVKKAEYFQPIDGLSDLNYTLKKKEYRRLYTYLLADIGAPNVTTRKGS